MAITVFLHNVSKMGAMQKHVPFWKTLTYHQLVLLPLFTPFQLFCIFHICAQGRSQIRVANQFTMEQQELDHSLGTSAGRGACCSSERSIRWRIKEGYVLAAAGRYQHYPAGWSRFLLPCARWQHFDTPVFIAGLCSVVMAGLHLQITAHFLKFRHDLNLFGYFKLQVSVEPISSNWV